MRGLASRLRGLSFCRFYSKLDLRSDRCAASGALGEAYRDDADCYLAQHCRGADFARGGCSVSSVMSDFGYLPMRISMPAINARMPRMTTGSASASVVTIP